jgi:hypothetical protein
MKMDTKIVKAGGSYSDELPPPIWEGKMDQCFAMTPGAVIVIEDATVTPKARCSYKVTMVSLEIAGRKVTQIIYVV